MCKKAIDDLMPGPTVVVGEALRSALAEADAMTVDMFGFAIHGDVAALLGGLRAVDVAGAGDGAEVRNDLPAHETGDRAGGEAGEAVFAGEGGVAVAARGEESGDVGVVVGEGDA